MRLDWVAQELFKTRMKTTQTLENTESSTAQKRSLKKVHDHSFLLSAEKIT